jgi:hypothetical protein
VSAGFLIVGEPQDGQRVVLPEGRRFYRCPVYHSTATVANMGTAPDSLVGHSFDYVAMDFAGDDTRVTLLVPEGWTGADALLALVEGYRGRSVSERDRIARAELQARLDAYLAAHPE